YFIVLCLSVVHLYNLRLLLYDVCFSFLAFLFLFRVSFLFFLLSRRYYLVYHRSFLLVFRHYHCDHLVLVYICHSYLYVSFFVFGFSIRYFIDFFMSISNFSTIIFKIYFLVAFSFIILLIIILF